VTPDPVIAALGLCRKAGKLAIGFDASAEAIRKGAPLVILAVDAADRTARNIRALCPDRTRVIQLKHTRSQIAVATGRETAVAAVNDRNFATLIAGAADRQQGDSKEDLC